MRQIHWGVVVICISVLMSGCFRALGKTSAVTTGVDPVVDTSPPVDDPEPSTGGPVVTVDAVSTNSRPTWTWVLDESATQYRYRLDGGAWVTKPSANTPVFTPSQALALGNHTLEVQQMIDAEWSGSGSGTVDIVLSADRPMLNFTSLNYSDVTPNWSWAGPLGVTAFRYRLYLCTRAGDVFSKPGSPPEWTETADATTLAYESPELTLEDFGEESDAPNGKVVIFEIQQMIDGVWSESAENLALILKENLGDGEDIHLYDFSDYEYDGTSIYELMANQGAVYQFTFENADTGGDVWGVDFYTNDSTITRAARHMGLLTHGGSGTVQLRIEYGASSYLSSSRNGVTSESYHDWPGSYTFIVP